MYTKLLQYMSVTLFFLFFFLPQTIQTGGIPTVHVLDDGWGKPWEKKHEKQSAHAIVHSEASAEIISRRSTVSINGISVGQSG